MKKIWEFSSDYVVSPRQLLSKMAIFIRKVEISFVGELSRCLIWQQITSSLFNWNALAITRQRRGIQASPHSGPDQRKHWILRFCFRLCICMMKRSISPTLTALTLMLRSFIWKTDRRLSASILWIQRTTLVSPRLPAAARLLIRRALFSPAIMLWKTLRLCVWRLLTVLSMTRRFWQLMPLKMRL